MSKANHTISLSRVELEELERKAELLDSLILEANAVAAPSITNPGEVDVTHNLVVDEKVLAEIYQMSSVKVEHHMMTEGYRPREPYRFKEGYAVRTISRAQWEHAQKNGGRGRY